MVSRAELDALERQLRAALVALNKRHVRSVTLVEAVDEATEWSTSFDHLIPLAPGWNLDELMGRAPLMVCSAAAEIGFRFEGVGTEYWSKLSGALGLPIAMAQRVRIAEAFSVLKARYNISCPSERAFSAHFSIISWPIANALLPVDLVGPVARLLARAPVSALPGSGRSPNFASLRAWAAAAEGARLVDWLHLENPTARVLSALLTENRQSDLPRLSYVRLQDAIATSAEAFVASRVARQRIRDVKPKIPEERSPGRLALSIDASVARMFAMWPALPAALLDEARATARSASWRPRMWGAGGFLHPDMALSTGPFALAHQAVPNEDEPAYPEIAEVFGAGSDIAVALAARTIDWGPVLLFDPDEGRTRAEQRFEVLSGSTGLVWIATRSGGLEGLRRLGSTCGYTVVEADLSERTNRDLLIREGLLTAQSFRLLARHPLDAIGAPQGVVRPGRPFLQYVEGQADEAKPRTLAAGDGIAHIDGLSGRSGIRCEPMVGVDIDIVNIMLFERHAAFEALIERRLQLRVESRLPVTEVPVVVELEIDDRLIARGQVRLSTLPLTIPGTSPLLSPLYEDRVRTTLLETGRALLKIMVGRTVAMCLPLERPAASVDWSDEGPELVDTTLGSELVAADTEHPNRFVSAAAVAPPARGAVAYGLKLGDGRIADPVQIFTPSEFDLGDFAARFDDDTGSRRMFDHGRGIVEIARARIAWARGLCRSLASIAARTRIVGQFEEPLVVGLCGRSWSVAERSTRANPSDPHLALFAIALERGLAAVPDGCTDSERARFARAFRRHALLLDPQWPFACPAPADGAMDDALNAAYAETVRALHEKSRLLDIDEEDCDFGSVAEEWERASSAAMRMVGRQPLVSLLAPSEGGRQLGRRSYQDISVAELAEDLSAWAVKWALPRGQISTDAAAGALLLWLSPAACNDVDAVVRILAVDPFVARATRYAALRLPGARLEEVA